MIFKIKKHNSTLYNTLLTLSRNLYFYNTIKLKDTFETRIYLMFMHFSIMLIASKKRNDIFPQTYYDNLFHSIENNLRELGQGDVAVNKKMKELVRLFNEILLYCETWDKTELNHKIKYLTGLFKENDKKNINIDKLLVYIDNFVVNIELMSLNLLLKGIIKIKK